MSTLPASRIATLNMQGLRLAFSQPELESSLDAYFGAEQAARLRQVMGRDAVAPHLERASRTVVLLPGFLGSGLEDKNRLLDSLVWIEPFQLMLDGFDRLVMSDDGWRDRTPGTRILAGEPVPLVYAFLTFYLTTRGFHVETFPFDWRRRIDATAHALHQRIEHIAAGNPDHQVSLVAHSMGCVVAKRYFQLHPDEAARRLDHAVLIAPPFGGTFAPAEVLSGEHSLLQRFTQVLPHLRPKILQAFRTFPGLYQLLPDPERFTFEGVFDAARWAPGSVSAAFLEEGRQLMEALREPSPLLTRASIVVSSSLATTVSAAFEQGPSLPTFNRTGTGDGTVLVESAWQAGARHFLTGGEHSLLPALPAVIEGTAQLLLSRGSKQGDLRPIESPSEAVLQGIDALIAQSFRHATGLESMPEPSPALWALADRIRTGQVQGADLQWLSGAGSSIPPTAPSAAVALVTGASLKGTSIDLRAVSSMPSFEPLLASDPVSLAQQALSVPEPSTKKSHFESFSRAAADTALATEPEPQLSTEDSEKLYAAFAPPSVRHLSYPQALSAAHSALATSATSGLERFDEAKALGFGLGVVPLGERLLGEWVLKALKYEVPVPGAPPPLNGEQMKILANLVENHPAAIEVLLRIAMKKALSVEEGPFTQPMLSAAVQGALADARAIFEAPDPVAWLSSYHAAREAEPAPAGLSLDPEIPVLPGSVRFEPLRDLMGWLVFAAAPAVRYHLARQGVAPFRRHDDYASKFRYDLAPRNAGQPISVAVFGDFGTGLYTSRLIAKRIALGRFDCAVHLGDVYYAGREEEIRRGLKEPFAPMLDDTALYLLAGNHEMYSGGHPLLAYIDEKRANHQVQRQQGPYFRLCSERFQLIGLDTEWDGHGELSARQKQWLATVVAEGAAQGLVNVLLTSNEPYAYREKKPGRLLREVVDAAGPNGIAAWFWGNTHYFGLFRRAPGAPFIGCCSGHGGYPYKRLVPDGARPVPEELIDMGGRFSGAFEGLSDRGNNGYCELQLHPDGSIGFTYRDWTGRAVCTRLLVWSPATRQLDITAG